MTNRDGGGDRRVPRWLLPATAVVIAAVLLAWTMTRLLERVVDPPPAPIEAATPPPPETAHIRATLFFASSDGAALAPVRREVRLAADAVAQGREILLAMLEPAPAPYTSVVPTGTTLRAFYLTESGDAYVDLSAEASSAHPGGTFFELLTAQAIVQAVTANLPSIRRVQILIGGREVDTLAGHLDLRRPLLPDPSVIRGN